jgi:putative hydrolase of the HAD superfamily
MKIISFDLDGTLVKSSYADLVWLEGLPEIYAMEKKIELQEAKNYLKKEYDRVGSNRKEWYDLEYWFNRFNLKFRWRELLERYRYAIEPFPETRDVLDRLHKNFDLIVISNAKREFIEIELEEARLKEYFSCFFSSVSDFHKVKKVRDFYLKICDKLGIKPYEMIHVGDHLEFDYETPKSVGIKSFYLNREKEAHGDHVVYDLREFEEKIKYQEPARRKKSLLQEPMRPNNFLFLC